MFLRSDPRLLAPIHSLLSKPLQFRAAESIRNRIGNLCQGREDFEALSELCTLYDQACSAVAPDTSAVRYALESTLSVALPLGANLSAVCSVEFDGVPTPTVVEVPATYYLAHSYAQGQLERLYDHMEVRLSGRDDALGHAATAGMLRFYLLNQALALALAGIARVQRDDHGFLLSVFNDDALVQLRAIWFASSMDKGAQSTLPVIAKRLADADVKLSSDPRLGRLVDQIMDRELAIGWSALGPQAMGLKTVQHMRSLVSLVAVLMVAFMRGEPILVNRRALSAVGLDFDFVREVITRQASMLATDRFIERRNDVLVLRIEATSMSLRAYLALMASEYNEVDQLRLHVGGFFFEERYVRGQIESDDRYRERYAVHDGFDRHQVLDKVPSEVDIDFVLHDRALSQFYFIQAKHALKGETAHFESAIASLQKGLNEGLRQLREGRRLLESGDLVKTLAARDISTANASNSRFILLHNIARFDFQETVDGIALYEWATFRNLLLDCEVAVGHSSGPVQFVRMPKPVDCGSPSKLIDDLFQRHPVYKGNQGAIWAIERATTTFDALGTRIRVRGLGV